MDSNGDGEVSIDEFEAGLEKIGGPLFLPLSPIFCFDYSYLFSLFPKAFPSVDKRLLELCKSFLLAESLSNFANLLGMNFFFVFILQIASYAAASHISTRALNPTKGRFRASEFLEVTHCHCASCISFECFC